MNILILLLGILPVLPSLILSYRSAICPKEIEINLTKKQNEQLKYDFFVMLGMSTKFVKPPDKKLKSSSKFLLDVYNLISSDSENRIQKRSTKTKNDKIIDKIQTSDVIVTLNNVQRKSKGKYKKLTFSLKNFPEASYLIGAELKIYQEAKPTTPRQSMYKIYVFTPFDTTTGRVKVKKMAEKMTTTEYIGWITIDITYLFRIWLKAKRSLEEIYLSANQLGVPDDEGEPFLPTVGLVLECESCENQPFIVAFMKNDNKANMRLPRNILNSRKIDFMEFIYEREDSCNIFPYKVSFKELMWQDWIIAPAGFTSSFCEGRCKFPLKFPIEATNHAIIQSLIHLKNPTDYPEPKCTPTTMEPLTILYLEGDNTILKRYNDMLVTSCGCH